ncbi:hypothetical protein [Parachitinimonas caeni]|uniref:Molecular chaperone n=1 Tax=Parachitinimonas caeni TaxID=3031301 RepID=A0ABT7DX65_9NEIS|nr:hypothetical protein [Parachitinimonas caeni]MDK2123237.1 hypothetical protein [Parachitinimonas caeni]
MTISFSVPTPVANPHIAVETNPKALKAWLVSLPHANLLETSRAICDALATLNRVKIDADTRQKLLEHYQVTIDMLEAPLEQAFTSGSVPMKDKARNSANMARALQMELANGYKLAILDKLEKRFSFGNKQLPQLFQHLLMTYQKLFWVCCKCYCPLPPGVWFELHCVFRHVIQHKMIDGPEEAAGNPNMTLGGLYKQILLLSLADPYRYSTSDLDKIQDLIRNYGAAAQFQPLTVTPNPAGFFLVRLETDSPPVFLGQRPVDVDSRSAILLDTLDMAKHLHKALQSVESKAHSVPDKAKAQAWIDLLKRVIRQWSIAPKRVFQRIRASSLVEVCAGIRSASFYANGAKALLQPVVLDTGIEVSEQGSEGPATLSGAVVPPPDDWVVLNESPGGYAIRMQPVPQHCQYRVGDIVGLQSREQGGWMVAASRWLQVVDEGDAIEMGVQILASKAEAALIRPTIAHQGTTFQPCLLLPEVVALKQAPLIAAARGTFGPMRELAIYTDEGEYLVRATKLIEQAIGFDLFEYMQSTGAPG